MTHTRKVGVPLLLEMLTWKRPAHSWADAEFCRRYIAPTGARPDDFGNYVLRIGTAPVAWMCHTDTVHHKPGRQRLRVRRGIVSVRHPKRAGGTVKVRGSGGTVYTVGRRGECLGADDTAGVWLMLEMIRAGVEGLYIFHRAEETGCQGSGHIVKHTPELVDGIEYAISLDRAGDGSVITHQMGRRTASDGFAWSLADALGLGTLAPDNGGVYTDSECYSDLVPECTNLSVGYDFQHSPDEMLDLEYIARLRAALLDLNTGALVVARDPLAWAPDGEWWEQYTDTPPTVDGEWSHDPDVPDGWPECELCGAPALGRTEGVLLCEYCTDHLARSVVYY